MPPPPVVVFQNVHIFNGRSSTLSAPSQVLIRGNKIDKIFTSAGAARDGATVINGGGRVLMPGLIDAHRHSTFATIPISAGLTGDLGYLRSSYQGKLGVVEQGALIEDPAKNFVVIVKDGTVYKNALSN